MMDYEKMWMQLKKKVFDDGCKECKGGCRLSEMVKIEMEEFHAAQTRSMEIKLGDMDVSNLVNEFSKVEGFVYGRK